VVFAAAVVLVRATAQDEIRPAPQIGPSCAFFGNIPALTLQTGVDISNATEFIRPIYGLHRGDFRFGSSFDKFKFFELFAILYTRTEIKHPALARKELLPAVESMISTRIDPALDKGRIFSLRCVGAFGGPHNVLLLGKQGGKYRIHDSYPGTFRLYDRKALAEILLVRSSATKHLPKPRYVTHLVELTIPNKKWDELLTPGKLPATLEVVLTPNQRRQLAMAFRSADPPLADKSLTARIHHFQSLDFAALPPRKKDKPHRNIVNDQLEPKQLLGLVRLSQFTLSVWNLGRRDLLPVLFLDGKPQVLRSYRKDASGKTSLLFDDGTFTVEYDLLDAMKRVKKDGSMFATVSIPQDGGKQ